jgi:Coenzyme PQQ synthesis protein D (PqqD)
MPNASYKPLARKKDLLTANLEGEIVILDTKTNRAVGLNSSIALIWSYCDGETTVSQIVDLLRETLHPSADESSVWHSLQKLQRAKLLQEDVPIPEDLNLPSRRELFKVLGLGVGAITVMLIPTPASAASPCVPKGGFCTMNSQCCSGRCLPPLKCQ